MKIEKLENSYLTKLSLIVQIDIFKCTNSSFVSYLCKTENYRGRTVLTASAIFM